MEESKKERKPFVPSPKWLAAQARLKIERINNPQKFTPKKTRKKRIQLVPSVSRSDFNDATIAMTQSLMNVAFGKLQEQLANSTEKGNPVATSLVLKNLNDISNSTQGSGALSRSKESKFLTKIDGKSLSRDGLIALNETSDISQIADIQQFVDKDRANQP